MPAKSHWLPFLIIAAMTWFAASPTVSAQDESESLSRYYGFSGIEIFKLERRSGNMVKGDFNSDGLLDVLLVDNSHSRLDLLQQRKEGEPEKPSRVNDIKNDWRFEHVKIPVDRSVGAMTIGDLNNDDATDIVYLGAPDRLIVRYQSKDAKATDWSKRFTVRLPNVTPLSWMMACGDLNGDKRDDIVVLGKTKTYFLYQQEDGTLAAPVGVMNTSTALSLVQIADLDGDGRHDLSYLATEDGKRGLCARMQLPSGQLGPELRFDLQRPRSVTLFNIDETPETEILTIDTRTGRVAVSRMKRPEPMAGELAARLTQYGFGEEGSGKDRDFQIGDINGDGLVDVVGTDPDKAQMLVFLQEKGRGLGQAKTFPGLLGANHVRIADLNGDGLAEVIVMSTKEKVVAISNYKDGRLSFPRSVPFVITPKAPGSKKVDFTPTCIEVADLNTDGTLEIVCVGNVKDGSARGRVLKAMSMSGDGWDTATEMDLATRNEPTELRSVDVNNDGKHDLIVFFDLNKQPAVFLNEGDKLVEFKPAAGIQLGKLSAANVSVSMSDEKTGLLVSQETFARRLMFEENQWQVADQYNAAESKAEVDGSAELNLDGEAGNEIVLIDSGVKKLRVLRKQDNVFRPWKEVELGAIEHRASHVGDFNGDGKKDLLLVGKGQFAVLYAEQSDPTLEEIASFETKLERVFFQDIVAGDLNADGRPDLAIVDTRSQMVEILNFEPTKGLRHAIHFKVFEGKSFAADRARAGVEPRESLIADVTGDGRADLLLLAHDRVLLYPQDPGGSPVAADDKSESESSEDDAAN
ncbi:MAG: FG-GAP repeat domain-containing protein [Planctomycetaceae bacterium]